METLAQNQRVSVSYKLDKQGNWNMEMITFSKDVIGEMSNGAEDLRGELEDYLKKEVKKEVPYSIPKAVPTAPIQNVYVPEGQGVNGTTAPQICPTCGNPMKLIPAGVSKKTGKPYSSFWTCNSCKPY